jgi:hypothetical protein
VCSSDLDTMPIMYDSTERCICQWVGLGILQLAPPPANANGVVIDDPPVVIERERPVVSCLIRYPFIGPVFPRHHFWGPRWHQHRW